MDVHLNRKRIFRGIRVFLFLTVLGVAIVFYMTGSQKTWLALQEFQLSYFLLACLLIIVDFLSGTWRIHIFIRKIKPRKSFSTCFKANLANIFLAAATPFQTGGGIAQLFVLNRYGVPYAAGTTVSVINFVATLSMLFVAASIILTTIPNRLFNQKSILVIMDVSRIAFYFTLFLFLFFILRPAVFGRFVKNVISWLAKIFTRKRDYLNSVGEKIFGFIEQYQEYLRYYWKEGKFILLLNYIFTIILYFNKCLVAYVIFLGLGLRPDFWLVVMLQMLIVFFLYFAPTPGASFVAETSTSAIMSLVAPTYLLSIFAILWRFFTTYFGVILGSVVLLRTISPPKPEAIPHFREN